MSENEMSQQERDAAEVQRMRDRLNNFGAFAPEGYAPALREIDRLRAENERLRAACKDVPAMLRDAAIEHDWTWKFSQEAHYEVADAITAALASDANESD